MFSRHMSTLSLTIFAFAVFIQSAAAVDLVGTVEGLLDVNFICERGAKGTFMETDCGKPLDSSISTEITADHIISDALHSCVREVLGLNLDFLRPTYSTNVRGRGLLVEKRDDGYGEEVIEVHPGRELGTYSECRYCPCDSRACCDLGYCTGSKCCRNCSCKRRRELLLGSVTTSVLGGSTTTTTTTTTSQEPAPTESVNTLDLFQQLMEGADELLPELELSVQISCSDHIQLVAAQLKAMGNKCLGNNPAAVTCYAKIL